MRNGLCDAEREYGVRGIPHAALVDREGNIVFMGHYAQRNLEVDIASLLEGKELVGEGTELGNGGTDEYDGPWIPNVDEYIVETALDKFEETSEAMLGAADVRRVAHGMQRCYSVLVLEQRHDCTEDRRESKMKYYAVLAGKK